MAANSFGLTLLNRMNMREQLIRSHEGFSWAAFTTQLMELDVGLEEASAEVHRSKQLLDAYGFPDSGRVQKPFAYADGVAIIPVHGTLVNRWSYGWSWLTGYNFIRSQAMAAAADDDVHTILYDINSGGGEASGCFELCDDLYALRSQKKTVSVVDAYCCSAAYAVGSAAEKVIVTPSGWAGSIGVVVMWVGLKGMLDKNGVEIKFIYAGDHKVDGNPYEELSEEVQSSIQANVNLSYDAFVAQVARNRGMSEDAVRGTQARVFRAGQALEVGLIDAVEAPSKALSAFELLLLDSNDAEDGSETPTPGDDPDNDQPDEEQQTMPPTQEAAQQAAQQADAAEAQQAAAPQALDAAAIRNEERARMSGILNCEEAKTRPALANHIATKTSMSLEDAQAMLAAASPEKEQAAATTTTSQQQADQGKSAFTEAMNSGAHPNAGAGAEAAQGGAGGGQEMSKADRILADQTAVTGYGKKKAA